jgi:YidC/Oxa1 family membrane protein insertase
MFQTLFYQPILNLVVFLYDIIPGHDLGLAIIALTVIIKLALLPLSKQAIKAQKSLQDLQPKMEEIKKKYADNKEEMSKAMLALYKDNKVNPLSSCLPLLIQLPFLWAVFSVFRHGFEDGALDLVYSFVPRPEVIETISLGLVDLSKPNVVLALLAGAAQFWQAKMMITQRPSVKSEGSKDESVMAMMNKQMLYMMPVLTVFIGLTLPGGLTLYWFVTTILTAIQQKVIFKKKDDEDGPGDKKLIEGELVK